MSGARRRSRRHADGGAHRARPLRSADRERPDPRAADRGGRVREGWLDDYETEKWVGYGVVDADLTDSTLLTFGLSRQQTNPKGVSWGGIPPWTSDFDLVDWPWGTTVGADWTYVDTQDRGLRRDRARVRQRLDRAARLHPPPDRVPVTARLVVRRTAIDPSPAKAWATWAGTTTASDPGFGERRAQRRLPGARPGPPVRGRRCSARRARATRRSPTSARWRLDRRRLRLGRQLIPSPTGTTRANAQTPTRPTQYGALRHRPVPCHRRARHDRRCSPELVGRHARPLPGVRISTATSTSSSGDDPYLGVTYDLNETFTAYGSITSIYKPQLVQDIDRNYLDPTFGYNYELGVKAGLFDGALLRLGGGVPDRPEERRRVCRQRSDRRQTYSSPS